MSFFAFLPCCSPPKNDREPITDAAPITPKNYEHIMQFLSQVPLVKRLPKDQYPLIASACVQQQIKAGEVVIRQGDVGEDFYVIQEGEAQVTVLEENGKEKKVLTLKAADYFGENALLRDEPRLATVTAITPLSVYTISRKDFQALGLSEKLQFANRRAVGGGMNVKKEKRDPGSKTPEERKLIGQALRANENIQGMLKLSEKMITQIADICWKEDVAEGMKVIKEGDIEANYFYIVQTGKFDIHVTKSDKDDSSKNGSSSTSSTLVSEVGPGGSFGELALMYLVPRAATVTAKVKSVCWVIDRGNFKDILMKDATDNLQEYVKYLDRVEILNALLAEEKMELAKAMKEMHFTKGEIVLRQGDPGDCFFILIDGEVTVIKDGVEVTVLQASNEASTAHYFGERALLNKENRAATVKVTSETAKILSLHVDIFNMLLGPLQELMSKSSKAGEKSAREAKIRRSSQPPNVEEQVAKVQAQQAKEASKSKERVQQKDLGKIGLLGCGGFGIVELVEHKVTGNTYALKGLSKGYVVKTGMQESVKNEKSILLMTNSAFIIMLYETFNSPQMLYFLMEPALGGEIYSIYNRKGLYGKEGHAKYYSAGVTQAFDHLHERHVIYRDLKPENLLLNSRGNLKLTDMGLAKFVIGKTYTTCGTPDYFAPELIQSKGHTSAVDWWALGILIFELMTGRPPFESSSPMQIYNKVMRGVSKVNFPPSCQGAVAVLIKSLLQQDPAKRLPVRPGGIQNLKNADWYRGFDWDEFVNLTMDVPFKPVVRSRKDIGNFSVRQEDLPQIVKYVDDGSGWDASFASSS